MASDEPFDIYKPVRGGLKFAVPTDLLRNRENQNLFGGPPKEYGDYDFIGPPKVGKKAPKAKTAAKPAPKPTEIPKTKAKRGRKSKTNAEVEAVEQPALPPLSPVSQMIFEMEQSQKEISKKILEEENEAIANLPVARRTRSSLGKTAPPPAAPPPTLPPKRKSRGKTRKSTSPGSASRESLLSLVSHLEHCQEAASRVAPRRRRRREIAEIGARAPVLDSIDLVSAVLPVVEGFINLDSDDDSPPIEIGKNPGKTIEGLNEDIDNPFVTVNINWRGDMQFYKLRQHQKFAQAFEEVAKANKVPVDHIKVNLEDRFILPNDTPHSVGLKSYDIILGRAVQPEKSKVASKTFNPALLNLKPQNFQLKVQTLKSKEPLVIAMEPSEPFKILYFKVAGELNCKVQDFTLFFDGELLEPKDTPENQEMEGNEMIELVMKTK